MLLVEVCEPACEIIGRDALDFFYLSGVLFGAAWPQDSFPTGTFCLNSGSQEVDREFDFSDGGEPFSFGVVDDDLVRLGFIQQQQNRGWI